MNDEHVVFRNELKYPVSAAQIALLRSRICQLLQLDTHVNAEECYLVRSLYFDDTYNSCFYDNENGTSPREKFRLRIYNGSDSRILLECKRKERGKTHKTTCAITPDQARLLMQGKALPDVECQSAILRKMVTQIRTRGLRPVVIVEYRRIPYICRSGNTRVTFDTDISASSDILAFLDKEIAKRPVMPAGQHLMEVKYDSFLPDTISSGLNLGQLCQSTYSKYYLCRKFAVRK